MEGNPCVPCPALPWRMEKLMNRDGEWAGPAEMQEEWSRASLGVGAHRKET